MDTGRYVKCGALHCDCKAEIWALAGRYLYPRCNGKAHYWVLMDSELYMRCKKHLPRDFAGFSQTFTNLQDALAALAMEEL